jgi:hypothetical protein
MGLMLFERLQAEAKTPALLDALNMSFYSAILGRGIAEQTGLADKEETFITALFHNLGRTLVALYLPAESKAIRAETDQQQDAAVLKVLGMSYSSIGVAVARALNLPERLLQSMNRITGSQSHASMTDEEKLGALATLSNGVADALATSASPKLKKQAIDRLVKSYGAQFGALDSKTMDTLIAGAETELHEHSKMFKLPLEGSSFAAGLSEFKSDAVVSASVEKISSVSAAGGLVDVGMADLPTEEMPPEALLTQGLHEVTSLLVTEFTLDDVLRVILETIYRALGVARTRAFFMLKDAALPKARFRFGMGQSAADMRTWMEVPLKGTQDLFVLALNQARDLVIKDLRSAELDPLIPDWYRPTTLERRYAVLLPLVVNQRSVGLFYVDGDETGAPLLTPTVINNLKVLRSQAVLAIHQSTLRSAARKR